ncbi:response regulator [Pseudaminobacter sp. NGMCC 1.201702]|uniref:response regulator n=1 Tax=Pseudaminobacter sp. NGMCC 1.201702 TaxID=3391825 RepID=UPI0039EFFA00
MTNLLSGLRILILEDEYLIAMDIEQLCRDHGAADVAIVTRLAEFDGAQAATRFDAAILDIMIGGESTLAFAGEIKENGVPFIFASGYTDTQEIFEAFPGVILVGKPYSGTDLVEALATACGRVPASGGV